MAENLLEPRTETRYAGFWLRFLAYLIDSLVLSIPLTVLFAVMFPLMIMISTLDRLPGSVSGLGFMIPMLIWVVPIYLFAVITVWLYFAVLESSSWQATIGKRICNIRVTDEKGCRVSFGRATSRYFGKILSGLIINIGYIMIAFTRRKQGLHDLIADCLVIKSIPPDPIFFERPVFAWDLPVDDKAS